MHPEEQVTIQTDVTTSGTVWVRIESRDGTKLLEGGFKPHDAPNVIAAAVDAFYSVRFANMAEGVRVVDERNR